MARRYTNKRQVKVVYPPPIGTREKKHDGNLAEDEALTSSLVRVLAYTRARVGVCQDLHPHGTQNQGMSAPATALSLGSVRRSFAGSYRFGFSSGWLPTPIPGVGGCCPPGVPDTATPVAVNRFEVPIPSVGAEMAPLATPPAPPVQVPAPRPPVPKPPPPADPPSGMKSACKSICFWRNPPQAVKSEPKALRNAPYRRVLGISNGKSAGKRQVRLPGSDFATACPARRCRPTCRHHPPSAPPAFPR